MRRALPTLAGVVTVVLALGTSGQAQGPTQYPQGSTGGVARPPVGQGDAEHRATTSAVDDDFMKKAATAGQAEIELSDLALKQGQSADVKTYASTIKTDHMKAATELKRLAGTKHVTLPSKLMADQTATRDRLAKLSGSAFDRAYADQMVTDHQEAVALFTTASDTQDSEVKAFASNTLPVLKRHLEDAQALQKKIGSMDARP